ncbi:uncharacterized protein LOC141903785 [Tubulanus polymorphus]|uniref:uncharacterized protein LOC141903785 n=1 Tax=Tubulanus polymorphus TaxID=672921 RepID=UPI003DA62BBD
MVTSVLLGLMLTCCLWNFVDAGCRSDCGIDDANLDCWRDNIDFYSNAILQSVNQRGIVANHIGEWKRKRNMAIYDPVRAAAVIEKIADKNPGPMPDSAIKVIFTDIVNETTVYEQNYHAKPPKFVCPDKTSCESNTAAAAVGMQESQRLFKVVIILQSIILIAQFLALGIMGYYLYKERRNRQRAPEDSELRPYK